MRNPLNDNKPVKQSRDGQAVPADIGAALCDLIDAKANTAGFRVATHDIDKAAADGGASEEESVEAHREEHHPPKRRRVRLRKDGERGGRGQVRGREREGGEEWEEKGRGIGRV